MKIPDLREELAQEPGCGLGISKGRESILGGDYREISQSQMVERLCRLKGCCVLSVSMKERSWEIFGRRMAALNGILKENISTTV